MELLRAIGLLKRLQVPSIVVNLGLGVVSLFPIWQDNLFESSFAHQRVEVRRGNTNHGNGFSGCVHSWRGFLSAWHTFSLVLVDIAIIPHPFVILVVLVVFGLTFRHLHVIMFVGLVFFVMSDSFEGAFKSGYQVFLRYVNSVNFERKQR